MADPITDPQAVKFGNEQIRPFCDRVPTIYAFLKHHALLFSDTPGLSDSFPADPAAMVADGPDGQSPDPLRRAYSGADVQALEAAVAGFVAQLEADDRALLKLVLKVAVNPAVPITL